MDDFTDLITQLEHKLSTIKVVSDLLYAKMGQEADGADEDAIIHFRAAEVENLLTTLETFVDEQETLIRNFIEDNRKRGAPEQVQE